MDFYNTQQDPILNPPALIFIEHSATLSTAESYVPFKQKMLDRLLHNQEAYTRVARRIVNNNDIDFGTKNRLLFDKVKQVKKEYKDKMKEVKVKLSAPNLGQNEVRRLKKRRFKLDKSLERDMITLKDAFDLVTLHETSDFSDTSSVASDISNSSMVFDPAVFSALAEINN